MVAKQTDFVVAVRLVIFKVFVLLCFLNPGFSFPFNENKNLTCYCDKSYSGGDHYNCVNNRCDTKGNPEILCYIKKLTPNGPVRRGCRWFPKCWAEVANDKDNGIRTTYCCDENLCNKDAVLANLTYAVAVTSRPTTPHSDTGTPTTKIVIYVFLPITICVIILAIVFLYKYYRKHGTDSNTEHLLNTYHVEPSEISNNSRLLEVGQLVDSSQSGSGFGLPLFIPKTIASEIRLQDNIGNGSFGSVFRGEWRGQNVAVKIFSTAEEASWRREVEIYTTTMLRHENVLGFIASDNKDTGACTQLWLISDYHPNGSLFDFLQKQTVSVATLIKMVFSIANGLWHLHAEIIGSQGKPAMAHRDIKTKNILVKNDYIFKCLVTYSCSVEKVHREIKKHLRFRREVTVRSLFVAFHKKQVLSEDVNVEIQNKIEMSSSSRTGTRRYQAPELLSQEIKAQCFESYQQADIYAMGLCIWEACRRTEIDATEVLSHELPYYDCVQCDPSEADMKQIVCIEKRRPQFHPSWHKDKVLKLLMKIMKECWYHDPSARLTALRIKKNLTELHSEYTQQC